MKDNRRDYLNDLSNTLVANPRDVHPIMYLFIRCLDDKRLLEKYLFLFVYVYQVHNEEILEDEDDISKINHINEKFSEML